MRAFAFRFSVLIAGLLAFPFPLDLLPGGQTLTRPIFEAWIWAVAWFAEHVLRMDPPPIMFTGSGDTLWHYVQLALIGTLALVGAAAWTALDRKPRPRIAAAMHVYIRYFLASMLLLYGFVKVYEVQFRTPFLGRYDQAIGDMSPMGLLWTFMGHSRVYTMFAGFAEVTAGVLLVWRRTAMLGAFVAIAVMTNVVLLNFCYDVPVKLLSVELLAMAFFVVAPQLRRILGAALGYAVPEVPPRTRSSFANERIRTLAKIFVLLLFVHIPLGIRDFDRSMARRPSPLDGIWTVETMRVDGVDKPALFTDNTRWRKLILCNRFAVVRTATDHRQLLGNASVDETTHTLTIVRGISRQPLHYTRVDETHIRMDGPLDGHDLELRLALDPPPLLPTRGFHWVQEAPFHR